MSDLYVNIRFKVVWQFKEFNEYKVTKEKFVVNSKTQKLLTYNQRGYFIKGKYYKKKELNNYLEKIPKVEYCPFSNGTIEIRN